MIINSEMELHSRVFRSGHFQKHIEFAMRGLLRSYMPNEQRLDYEQASKQLEPAIAALDRLHIDLDDFTSGITGAAIIMLMLHPSTIDFWRDLAKTRVYLDQDGFSAPGLLYYYLERHRNIAAITRRSDYQLFLFQTALALSSTWLANDNDQQRYRKLPRVPDAASLIDQVRSSLGQRNRQDGFRAPSVLRDIWHPIEAPRIVHACKPATIAKLARAGARALDHREAATAIDDALATVLELKPDPELAHPAALAAAAVTIASYPQAKSVWIDVFQRNGIWRPNAESGRWEANAAGMILREIVTANRSRSEGALKQGMILFERIQLCFKLRKEQGDVFRRIAPGASRTAELRAAWKSLNVNFQPAIDFTTPYQLLEQAARQSQPGRKSGQSRKPSRDATRKRIETGLKGEQWFMENFREVFPEFEGINLIDRRHHADGYDVLFQSLQGDWVELKTIKGPLRGNVGMGPRQWDKALEKTTRYWLVVVTQIDTDKPEHFRLNNPATHLDAKRLDRLVTQVTYQISAEQIRECANQQACRDL